MMKDKKGFIFAIPMIVSMVLGIILLGLLIWFGFRINEGLVAVFSFLKEWWMWIALFIFGVIWFPQIRAVVNAILNKFGIKV